MYKFDAAFSVFLRRGLRLLSALIHLSVGVQLRVAQHG